ncbi:hypothetical protein E4T49_08477 [Aureobasidium sp. EXF-10728]|nr:hypothetical protein E4T49_08477 [Aureobasidium sp. EXF-10728]
MAHVDEFDRLLNFRDVGAFVNELTGSTKLKPGMLFRSARPDEASTEDRRRLKDDYHIQTIIDLRTKSEHIVQAQKRSIPLASAEPVAPSNNQAAEPVKIPGLNYAEINFNGSSYSFALIRQLRYWSATKLIALMAAGYRTQAISILGTEVMSERGLIGLAYDSLAHCTSEVLAVFRVLADEKSYPVVVHCTQGKDRTGLNILLVLLLLHVDTAAINTDYMRTQEELVSEREARIVEIRSIAFAAYDQPVLGISIGSKDLTVVQSLPDGSTSLIARVPASSTYINWFEKAIKLPEQERSTIDATALHEALLAAQYASTQDPQQKAQFNIVTSPQEVRDLVLQAFSILDMFAPKEADASNYIRPESVVHYAYKLGTCEAARLPKGCDPEDIDGEALWLDFDADSVKTKDERTINALQKHFTDFLDQNTVVKDSPDRLGHNYKPLRSNIMAIIMSGNPPPGCFEAVKLAFFHISADLADLVGDSVDPSSAMAEGAARRAREMWDHPEEFKVHLCPSVDGHSHDEL